MLDRLFGKNVHAAIHTVAIGGVVAGVPFNKIMMSLSMMLMVLNLLLEGKFKKYWANLSSNRIYHLIFIFFLIHVIGLLWTTDMNYAIRDLNGKLPLLVIPTILTAKPVNSKKQMHLILALFVGSSVLLSAINFVCYQHLIGDIIYDDIRGMSLFGSHIRFGIILAMSCGILLYFMKNKLASMLVLTILFGWLSFYTFYSQVLSGIATWIAILTTFIIYYSYKRKPILTLTGLGIFIVSTLLILVWLFNPMTLDLKKYQNLDAYTTEGNPYEHSIDLITVETGEPMHIYICHKELSRDWPKYSNIPYYDHDVKGQPMQHTLLRYLSSKGLRKDAEGLAQLTQEDIRNVENGIATSINTGLMARLYSIKHQLINEDDPNGHSLLERLEYWRAGIQIAKENLLYGVGTGDVQQAFNSQYKVNQTQLQEDNWNRAHNMFLTMFITFGIIGGLYFVFFHLYYLVKNLQSDQIIPVLFMALILTSYLVEDTLETQTAVTFFALFYGLFCSQIRTIEEENNPLP